MITALVNLYEMASSAIKEANSDAKCSRLVQKYLDPESVLTFLCNRIFAWLISLYNHLNNSSNI